MGYGRISGTAMGPYPHRVRRHAPRPFAGLSPHRVYLAQRAAQPLNDEPMWTIDYCRIIVRGCVDPREYKNRISSPVCQDFWNGHSTLYPPIHGGVALMFEPQPISGKRIWLEFHVVRSGVDTRGHRYYSCIFGAVDIRGIHESGMDPIFPRVRRKCPKLMGLCPPRTALWSSNQSALIQQDWGFLTGQGGVDPRKLRWLSWLMGVLDIYLERPLDRLYPPEVELAQHANHGQSESQSAGGVGISTPYGEVSCVYGFWSRHVTLSCAGDAYFVYQSCPMPDQTKLTFFFHKTRVWNT